MVFELLADLAKLVFFVVGAYLVLQAWARRRRPDWAWYLTRRRLAVLGVLTLAMSAVKVIEDVVAHESGPIDTALLWFVREHVPAALTGFFAAVTWSGSAEALVPASAVAAVALLAARRRFEALLMGTSMVTATLLVYALKALVGRFVVECLGRHDLPRHFLRSRDEALDAGKTMGCDVVVRDVTLEDVFIELTGERIDA